MGKRLRIWLNQKTHNVRFYSLTFVSFSVSLSKFQKEKVHRLTRIFPRVERGVVMNKSSLEKKVSLSEFSWLLYIKETLNILVNELVFLCWSIVLTLLHLFLADLVSSCKDVGKATLTYLQGFKARQGWCKSFKILVLASANYFPIYHCYYHFFFYLGRANFKNIV